MLIAANGSNRPEALFRQQTSDAHSESCCSLLTFWRRNRARRRLRRVGARLSPEARCPSVDVARRLHTATDLQALRGRRTLHRRARHSSAARSSSSTRSRRSFSDAFVITEDKRFYEHAGIDWQPRSSALSRADIVRSGRFDEGFSTITMQLARNIFPEQISREKNARPQDQGRQRSRARSRPSSTRKRSSSCTSTRSTSATAPTASRPRRSAISASRFAI